MSKRFNGIAIAKDLGQDIGSNSSVLENVKGVLYAENINSVVYYDKNLDLLGNDEAPTKKYVLSLRDTNDCIQLYMSNFDNSYTKDDFDNYWGNVEEAMNTYDSIYECYPSNSAYIIEWNGKNYYKWNCIAAYSNSWPLTQYFLTETCDYTELKQRSMLYAYENGLAYWDKTHKMTTISIAEFDEDGEEIDYESVSIFESHDLRLTDVNYLKNENGDSTTVTYDDVQNVKYVDIKVGAGKEQSACDWITLYISTALRPLPAQIKRYICNPSDPNYIFTYNNLKYFLWKYLGTGNTDQQYWTSGSEQHAYFITSIADYDVLLNCTGNALNNYLITELDINKNEVSNILGSNTIISITHFKGLYFKSIGITEIGMEHDNGFDTNHPNIEYSTNYGRTWSEEWDGSTIYLSNEQIIWFRGLNPDGFNHYDYDNDDYVYSNFTITIRGTQPYGYIYAYGSVMSLIDGQDGTSITIPTGNYNGGCFAYLFSGCGRLLKAPELPATSLAEYCYSHMFYGCTALAEAPALPATGLAEECYCYMFWDCTSLSLAPELPATSLANGCYNSMFYCCTALTEAPVLHATRLVEDCYCYMFEDCTSLTEAPTLPATSLASYCYSGMFYGCTTLTKAPALPATSLANGCYSGMFSGCTSLTEAPALPATSLASYCYSGMFYGCTSLTEAPTLPATSLTDSCYDSMFSGCTSLTEAPTLPATSLATRCYAGMFLGTSLTEAPALHATSLANYCYYNMFSNCTSLTEAPALPATNLVNSCYAYMFYGCKNLSYINCLATSNITTSNCNNWVNGVAPYGTFVKAYLPTAWSTGVSGVPTNWVTSVPAVDNQATNFVSIHILLDPEIENPSITISFPSVSSNHTLQYAKTVGGWSSRVSTSSLAVTITGTEILYLRGTLTGNNSTNNYTNILITSSNGSKAILSGNCNAIWNYNLPTSPLAYEFCGYGLFMGSTALFKVNKDFLPISTLRESCYRGMFRSCSNLVEAPNLPVTDFSTNTATYCYMDMFYGCTRLVEAPTLPATSLSNGCYSGMFRSCISLTKAPSLSATSLAYSCYNGMFWDCTSLSLASELPATSLDEYCYANMFRGCTSLTEAPTLPATSLTDSCYDSMFMGCTSLTEAPVLPATSLDIDCYSSMFRGCTSLTEAPALPATSLADGCYNHMFYDCKNLSYISCNATTNITTDNCNIWLYNVKSSGTFYKNSSATWSTGSASGIPSGWNSLSLNNINSENNCIEIRMIAGSTATITFVKISTNHTLQYKDNNHNSWTNVSAGNTITMSINSNPIVLLKGNLSAANTNNNYTLITITGGASTQVKLIGNCNYLWNSNPDAELKNYCGYRLFYGSTAITKVSKNFLPATSLASYCYHSMFHGCTSLTEAPTLPATSLVDGCYSSMFEDCTTLTEAPVLPATSLADYCYSNMFYGCTSLTEASALPATNLVEECYSYMFEDCTSLTEAPVLPSTKLADYCYYYMFHGCTSLTEAPTLPATSLVDGCYSSMFEDCTTLTEAPALPATSLAYGCYHSMFEGCTALSDAPVLPATNLASLCYANMFRNCTALSDAPVLPATSLANYCYSNMFYGCTSLTEAPALPATSLYEDCYSCMFYGCTSLTEAPALPATNLVSLCYYSMFEDCTSLTEVICFAITNSYTNSTTDWLANASSSGKIYSKITTNISVPSGWTIQIF